MAKKPVISRKEKVMKTALTMVANGGFHSTPMAGLAEKSGVAVGTIYHHFASKEELITALYGHVTAGISAACQSSVEGKGTYKDKFIRLWTALFDHFSSNKSEFAFLEQFQNSPFISTRLEEEGRKSLSGIYQFFKAGSKEGKLSKLDGILLAEYTFSTVATAARAHAYGGKRKLTPKDITALAEMTWAAVKA
jgi:AcrR family transcriptional regulator